MHYGRERERAGWRMLDHDSRFMDFFRKESEKLHYREEGKSIASELTRKRKRAREKELPYRWQKAFKARRCLKTLDTVRAIRQVNICGGEFANNHQQHVKIPSRESSECL
jgi:hypothetical protein